MDILTSYFKQPNIVKVYESQNIRSRLYIFQELIYGGDLFSYLSNGSILSRIPEFEALVITYQISQALKFLHQNSIAHRDLKLDNILLETPQPFSRIVLADFGIARTITRDTKRMYTTVGTPEYCAPEVGFEYSKTPEYQRSKIFKHRPIKTGYDSKCDLWSLGIILHIMLSAVSPFYSDGDDLNIARNAKIGKLSLDNLEWDGVSADAKNLVQCLLYVDIKKRCDIEQCLDHRWIKRHGSELKKIYWKIVSESSIG